MIYYLYIIHLYLLNRITLYELYTYLYTKKLNKYPLKNEVIATTNSEEMDYKQPIIDALTIMQNKEAATPGGHFKSRAYSKVIKQLSAYKDPIQSMKDIASFDGIGEKIHAKIVEIIDTGKLAAAERALADPRTNIINRFKDIHGVGTAKAVELIDEYGVETIDDLRRMRPIPLNNTQLKGLKYYECFLERIPRNEMQQHEQIILDTIHSIEAPLEASIVGSYRRGAETSGDIDVIVKVPAEVSDIDFLEIIVQNLRKKKYIIDDLAQGSKKYMGVSSISGGTPRRLDIMVTNEKTYPFALYYFTGSDKFNIAVRNYALEKGYTLNEYALTPLNDDVKPVTKIKEERDIFRFLKIEYVEPSSRIDASSIKPVRVLRIIRQKKFD